MTVKELISKLRADFKIPVEFREDNYFLCSTFSDSKALELFSEREVCDWFVDATPMGNKILVINIKSEDGE